jgi:hypothetical protein
MTGSKTNRAVMGTMANFNFVQTRADGCNKQGAQGGSHHVRYALMGEAAATNRNDHYSAHDNV